MNPTNQFPSKAGASIEIVVGGELKHPDPDQGCKLQSRNPLTHGPNIDSRDFPYTMIMGQASQSALETFDGPPEPGACVVKLPITGEPSSAVTIGTLKDKNMGSSSAGNMNNMGMAGIPEALNAIVNKIFSKGYQSTQEDGAEVRKPKDGDQWKHALTQGIPTHAAMFPLAGTPLESRQQIDTAKTAFRDVLGGNLLGNLPGKFMSIGDILGKLGGKGSGNQDSGSGSGSSNNLNANTITTLLNSEHTKNMTAETKQAFASMLHLMQSGDGGNGGFVGGRVDEETFLENVKELLSQVTDINDLMELLRRLLYDEDIRGTENLESEVSTTTPYGDIKQKVDGNGNVKNDIPDIVQKLIQALLGMLQSPQQAPSAGNEINLFRDQAENMSKMLSRMPPEVEQYRKKLLETVNTSPDAEIKKNILHLGAWEGGYPLSASIFKKA